MVTGKENMSIQIDCVAPLKGDKCIHFLFGSQSMKRQIKGLTKRVIMGVGVTFDLLVSSQSF